MNEARAQLDDAALRIRGILRHLPGKHDQSAHGRKGPKGAAKAAAKSAVAAVKKAATAEPKAPAKADAPESDRFRNAARGQAALDAAPVNFRGAKRSRDLSPAERKALDEYGSDAQRINSQIRRGAMSTRVASTVRNIDKIMDKSKLTTDAEVWRGISNGRSIFGDRMDGDLTGFTWTEEAFVSTSAARLVAEQFAGMFDTAEPVTVMRVLAPEGVGGIAMGDLGSGNALDDQAELIVDRNLPFRVVADQGVVEHPQIPQGVRVVDVIIEGP